MNGSIIWDNAVQNFLRVNFQFGLGQIKYYVIQKVGGWVGGWVKPNVYVCLHGGLVGVARCLRNQNITENIILRFFFINFCI